MLNLSKYEQKILKKEVHDEAIQQNLKDLPKKETDPRIVVLHVSICNMEIGNVLVDLGASDNIMPLSVVARIGHLQVKPYARDLEMVDKTCRKLVGAIKDVLILVDTYSFHVDFVIRDVKEDPKINVILGKPFMKTMRMLVDMDKEEFKVRLNIMR
ncbi:uncharacterized protein LOC131619784 [Vicia villosa]|uniref:uncharacterized protein LOC131619784 n=1 Tax=Vicia villosa TaxID=3911 RepID=UPI00273BB975|nr:uncharacterized protein LOC131619784 [Vicia villosa]